MKEVEKNRLDINVNFIVTSRCHHKRFFSADLETHKLRTFEPKKNLKFDLGGMVFGMDITNCEVAGRFDTKYLGPKTTIYTLPPGMYKINDLD